MGTPADVVKARIMNQATDHYGRGLVYKSSLDCAMQTIKGEGFLGELYSIIFHFHIRITIPLGLCFINFVVNFVST